MDEVINIVVGHAIYTFLNGFLGYHQISITLEDQHKIAFVPNWRAFCVGCDAIWCQKWIAHLS
jgi:hypothetical protein